MLALGGAPLSSPKQTTAERHSSLFPYYAGFSEAFVGDVLDALQPTDGEVVLDPWNGSGTTTAVAGRAGLISIGVDINPAMAVVAKARLATRRNLSSARNLLRLSGQRLSQAFLMDACRSPCDSATRSLLLLAIFRVARKKLRARERVATNPTWWQLQQAEVRQVICSIYRSQVDAELYDLGSRLSTVGRMTNQVSLVTADLLIRFSPC
jgi:DNA methylase